MPMSRPLRTLSTVTAALALVAASAIAYAALHGPQHRPRAALSAAAPAAPVAPATPWLPTRVRVSTFNVLGYGHTMPGGDNRLKVDGRTRQSQADQIIRSNNLQIVGFQEMEQPQIDVFLSQMGSQYELWPGNDYSGKSKVNVRGNSIAWRKDQWTALSKTYYNAPYFKGANVPRPIVLLQNKATGQQVYVTNTHNPANTFGNAQNYRDQSVSIQASTFNSLRRARPTTPIIFTGDMNDRRSFFCRLTAATPMRAVNGGIRTATKCTLPKSPQIDWIMSTPDVQWNGYQAVRTAYVKKTTDHPVVWADATFKAPMARSAGIARAVVLEVEGLPSGALTGSHASWAPHIGALRAAGASTLNARTTAEVRGALPNLVTILTGRPVAKSAGGHNVGFAKDHPRKKKYRTLRSATGAYVNTLFDTVHNQGGSTSFLSSDRNAAIVLRSARAGLPDSQGVDYGTRKLTVASIRVTDKAAVNVLKKQLRRSPRTLSVVQLSGPRIAGEKYGYFSHRYAAAVRRADRLIGQVVTTIRSNSRTAHSTALVLTSSVGGSHKSSAGTRLSQFQVPLALWAPHVPARGDLYAMNPGFRDPGHRRVGYGGAQPLRNANVANIVTTVLGYPSMPTPTPYGGPINVFQPANRLPH